MHGRAHIKDPASHPQVMQIQPIGSDNDIKNQWNNEEIYITVSIGIDFQRESESTHITGK
jgi:hypothetical protein